MLSLSQTYHSRIVRYLDPKCQLLTSCDWRWACWSYKKWNMETHATCWKGKYINQQIWIKNKETRNSSGCIENPNPKPVARGIQQVYKPSNCETYILLPKFATISFVLSIASHLDSGLPQSDVATACLNEDPNKDIFMDVPESVIGVIGKSAVCKLTKAPHRFKQALSIWNEKIYLIPKLLGSIRKSSNPCVCMQKRDGNVMIIRLYVDDFLLICNNWSTYKMMEDGLPGEFEIKCIGKAKHSYVLQTSWVGPEHTINLRRTKNHAQPHCLSCGGSSFRKHAQRRLRGTGKWARW